MTRHRKLDLYAHRLNRAADTVPAIYDHLDEQRAQVAYLAAHPTDTAGGTPGGHNDPTMRAVMALDQVELKRGRIDDYLATLGLCIDKLEEVCREALGYRVPGDVPDQAGKPRCIGDGTQHGAACWNIPAPRRLANGTELDDGRCHECGPRHDQQRRNASDARRLRRHAKGEA